MINRTTKLRWRRRIRASKRQVEDISVQAEESFERHFVKRLARLWQVRRFFLTWLVLLTLLAGSVVGQIRGLSHYYQELQPVPGGTYVEGAVGSFTNVNPLYAVGNIDRTVARLVFAGLFKYDQNNQLVGDLAESFTVDERGATYTVTLRPNLKWQDDQPLTATDVAFTYQTIQNPDARSPFIESWRGITISAPDPRTVVFALPNALSAFPYGLTGGIVPRHLLDGVPPTQLRSVGFNTVSPVGAGPFKWETIEVVGTTPQNREERIGLVPNPSYHAGAPKLGRFIVRAFRDRTRLLESFKDRELTSISGLGSFPKEVKNDSTIYTYHVPVTGATIVFFNTKQPLLADVIVRRALTMATDQKEIIKDLEFPAIPVREPLLKGQVGYDATLAQADFDPAAGAKLLETAGWKLGEDGVRTKDGQRLTLQLAADSSGEYAYVASRLQKQWRVIGVDLQVPERSAADLQAMLTERVKNPQDVPYDALLYGIAIGVDPDVFAYWHSSQADIRSTSRLNFSYYTSKAADGALEAGRTRADPQVRAIKYRPFLEAWRGDAPAIGLYQPRFLYITRGPLSGFPPQALNNDIDRFNNVENWMIRRERTTKLN